MFPFATAAEAISGDLGQARQVPRIFFVDTHNAWPYKSCNISCLAKSEAGLGGLRWQRSERLRRSRRRRRRAKLQRRPRSGRPPSAPKRLPRKHLGKPRVKRSLLEPHERQLASRLLLRGLGALLPLARPRLSLRRTCPRCWAALLLRRSDSTRAKRNRRLASFVRVVGRAGNRKIARSFAFVRGNAPAARVVGGARSP